MAYLSKKDWQTHLKRKENSSVKKTGISDILSDYEKAVKKHDNSAQMTALEKLQSKIDEVKRKWSKVSTVTSYLDSMKKEAKKQEDDISNKLAQTDDEDLEESGDLAKILAKVKKTATEDKPYQFVVAPGKPSTGLVLHRKKISASHTKKAREIRGKGGPFFLGTCFFNGGKFYFDFPDKPPSGMARSIKLAARLHAEMAIKVVVRGGGVEFDDAADDKLEESGETRVASGGVASYPKGASFDPLIQKLAQMPADKRPDVGGGLRGKLRELLVKAKDDPDLSDTERKQVMQDLAAALKKTDAVIFPKKDDTSTDTKAPAYPSLANWKELLENCLRLDPDKRLPALDALKKQWAETVQKLKADKGLTPQDLKTETQTLQAAKKLIEDGAREYVAAAKTAKGTDNAKRLKALETEFDMVRKQATLSDTVQKDVATTILAARKALAGGDAKQIAQALDLLEQKVKNANSAANKENARLDQGQKQGRVFDSVKEGIEVFKKASFASGTANAMFRDHGDLKVDSKLKKIGDDFRNCEKDPSPANLDKLSKDGQAYLEAAAKAKAKLKPGKDDKKIKALEAQEKLARQAVQRVRLLELANEMEAIGAPPWDDAKNERMAELQVAFFFEEGAIKQDVANFGAPQRDTSTEGDSANDIWWVERTGKEGSKSAKTYIFKPQELEATDFPGIPDKGGTVREGLASKLNDTLVNFGFDVGVCPTHLVEIDNSKLPGVPETGNPRTMGAIQEIAENDGNIAHLMRSDPDGFMKTIDRKNLSDIQVFDLMFLNLDRHGGNLLVKKGEDGKNRIIPIDHGIGLPDPEGLALTRNRIAGPQNILYDPAMPIDEPLNPETIANLKKVDAKQMCEGLKQQQLEMEKRRPDTKGKMDHAEFDRMAKRIEFMQAAADIMSARELTMAITAHARAINATDSKDMAKLAAELKKKLVAVQEGKKEIDKILKPRLADVGDVLKDYGWCLDMDYMAIKEWLDDNADLGARILKTQYKNPNAAKELRERLADVTDEKLLKTLEPKSLGQKLIYLREQEKRAKRLKKNEELKAMPDDAKGQDKLIKELGGDKVLQEIKASYKKSEMKTAEDKVVALRSWKRLQELNGDAEFKKLKAYFPESGADDVRRQVTLIEDWLEIQKLGGMALYIQLGGMGTTPAMTVDIFRDLKRMHDSGSAAEVMQQDDAKIRREQEKLVREGLTGLAAIVKTIKQPSKLPEFATAIKDISNLVKNGELSDALGQLETAVPKARKQSQAEKTEEKRQAERLAALNKDVQKAAQAKVDVGPFTKAVSQLAQLVQDHRFTDAERGYHKVWMQFDQLVNGDASEAAKLKAQKKQLDDRIAKLGSAPGGKLAQDKLGEATKTLNLFDLSKYREQSTELVKFLEVFDRRDPLHKLCEGFGGDAGVKDEFQKMLDRYDNELTHFNLGAADLQVRKFKETHADAVGTLNWP